MIDYIEHERRILQYIIKPDEPEIAVDGHDCVCTLGMLDEVIDNSLAVCLIVCPPDIHYSIIRQNWGQKEGTSHHGIPVIPSVHMPKEVWFYCIRDGTVKPYKKLVNVVA